MKVTYVLDLQGKPLMPCKPVIARLLLKQKNAKVIKRCPFIIQLLYNTTDYKQDINLGIDTGYKNIGFSAITKKCELMSGELTLENEMTKRLQDRAMYRRNRRSRLRYRKLRFDNRKKPEGCLPPSIQRRFDIHISLINQIKKILPITKVTVEVAKFDIQKLENPDIKSEEYQQGTMYEYRNRIAYLIAREKGKCQFCGKSYKKGDGWRLHHIWGKSKDRLQDWALLHESCHKHLHQKGLEKRLQSKKSKSYKPSTFMSIIQKRFKHMFDYTFGNITFQNRIDNNLEKSHINDAFIIAGGSNQIRCNPFNIIQKRKNNRQLQKNRIGFKRSIRKQRYSLQPKDLIKINNTIWTVIGIQNSGLYIKIKNILAQTKVISVKKLDEWKFHQKTLMWSNSSMP